LTPALVIEHNESPKKILEGDQGGNSMNMGVVDRVVRAIAAIALLLIAFLVAQGAWQIVLWVVGGILAVTALIGFCPLYFPFHFSTKKK
jgi:fatty acid desaturase